MLDNALNADPPVPGPALDELSLLVLSVLADGPRWGYAIQRRLAEAVGVQLSWGRLYPLLRALHAGGLLSVRREAATGRPRKWYALTDPGHAALRRAAAAWSADYARKQALVLPAVRRSAARRQAAGVNPSAGVRQPREAGKPMD